MFINGCLKKLNHFICKKYCYSRLSKKRKLLTFDIYDQTFCFYLPNNMNYFNSIIIFVGPGFLFYTLYYSLLFVLS